MSSFYTEEELSTLGLKAYGKNVQLSRNAVLYGAEKISLGNNVRIDDFSVLSGDISIGDHVHISFFSALMAGEAGIEVHDFANVSSRCAIYAHSDDYSGNAMSNPTIPIEYRNVIYGRVVLERHVLIGTGSTVLPGVRIGEGCSIGSMSLVNKSLKPWGMYVGVPCRFLKERSKKLLELEQKFRTEKG